MTPDPRTAPDRLRALFAEFDCINPEDLYDAVTQDPDMLVDVLISAGHIKARFIKCCSCGATGTTAGRIEHDWRLPCSHRHGYQHMYGGTVFR